ncbi:hypothetical protein GJAV_G00142480 [Gymnothorax javanicus]|nr:hypothetical protein GJAV_G00142480 [Gymnothorax javanicus]
MASPEVTLSPAAVDSTIAQLDSSLSADSSLLPFAHAAVPRTHLTGDHVSELAPPWAMWGPCSWAPRFWTADLQGPLLDEDEEFLGGAASPLSVSSADSSGSHLSLPPPLSLPMGLACKLGENQLTLPWLCDGPIGPANDEDAGLSGMDWSAEDLDLAEFDLDSLIGSYEPDEPPSSPEELIASLESQWGAGLDLSSLQYTAPESPVSSLPEEPAVPPPSPLSQEPWQVLEIKSEPASPARWAPAPVPSLLPSDTLELGSEEDVAEGDHATPGIVLSLSGATSWSFSPQRV